MGAVSNTEIQRRGVSGIFKVLVAAGREAIESLYASTARMALDRKEAFEDAQAERRSRQRAIATKREASAAAIRQVASKSNRA